MLLLSIFILTTIIYLAVGLYLGHQLLHRSKVNKTLVLSVFCLGLFLQAYALYPKIITLYGLNFNLINSLNLTSLFFGIFFVGFSFYRPILSLGLLATTLSLVGNAIGFFGRGGYQPVAHDSLGLQLHILLSFAAYCALLMAAFQAILLKLQIKELKHQTIHRFWVSRLPALQSMEGLLFDMVLLGFVLLSLALGLGLVFTYDIMAQHLAHKTLLSLLGWLIFGYLIFGHYRYGWRGKRAANITLYGFIFLALGFFGSKLVLEFLL